MSAAKVLGDALDDDGKALLVGGACLAMNPVAFACS